MVAPRAGAWVETLPCSQQYGSIDVAPRAGAWVETLESTLTYALQPSHPVRVRGLKRQNESEILDQGISSHPVRVRGLKREYAEANNNLTESHPVRVRGLKLHLMLAL